MHNNSGELLHHNPLPVGSMKVSVDLVLDTDALLPFPDVASETTLLRDAVGSFVGWPSDLIFPDAEVYIFSKCFRILSIHISIQLQL